MNVWQAWMLMGIPLLVLSAALFLRPSLWRSMTGYAALALGVLGMAQVDRVSAGVFGVLLALAVAAGRGGEIESTHSRANETGVDDASLLPSRRSGSSAA